MELILNLEEIYFRFQMKVIDNHYSYGDGDAYFDHLKAFRGEVFVNDSLHYNFNGVWGWPDAAFLMKSSEQFYQGTLSESAECFSDGIEEDAAFQVKFDPQSPYAYLKVFLCNQYNELTENGITLALTDDECGALAKYLALQVGEVSQTDPQIIRYIEQGIIVAQPGF